MKHVLVTGANGYIGTQLIPKLLDLGYSVHATYRSSSEVLEALGFTKHENFQCYPVNWLSGEGLDHLPEKMDFAYYLIHSMSDKVTSLKDFEMQCADNFSAYAQKSQVKQTIYVSGLIDTSQKLSDHFDSRLCVEQRLKASSTPVTIIEAGIVIGLASSSFTIIRDLVEKLPMMVAPRWVSNQCQPLSIHDMIQILITSLGNEQTFHQTIQVGGPDVLSYKQMLYQYADFRKLRRYILSVPVLSPRLSSYWLLFITSTPFRLAMSLVDSLKVDAVCKDQSFKSYFEWPFLSYKDSLNAIYEQAAQVLHCLAKQAKPMQKMLEKLIPGAFINESINDSSSSSIKKILKRLGISIDQEMISSLQPSNLSKKLSEVGKKQPQWTLNQQDSSMVFYRQRWIGSEWVCISQTENRLLMRSVLLPRGWIGRVYGALFFLS